MGESQETAEDRLAGMFAELSGHLDERQRRLVMGAQARRLGRGGIAMVARAAGVNRKTVARGVDELDGRTEPPGRVRARGAGRRRATEADDGLERALWELIDPRPGGERAAIRWTTGSVRRLTDTLSVAGHPVSTWTVSKLLRDNGFRIGTARGGTGSRPAGDRDRQFRHLDAQATAFLAAGDPVVSLAAWKEDVPRPAPPGGADETRVPVGADRETAAFAVATLRRWWAMAGAQAHPGARRLLVTADSVHAAEHRSPWLRTELAGFAADAGLTVTVCHLPPAISRWSRLEHQLSDQVALSLRGRPVTRRLVVVGIVGGPTDRGGAGIGGGERGADAGRSAQVAPAALRHDRHGDRSHPPNVD